MYQAVIFLLIISLSHPAVVKLTGENGYEIYKGEWMIKAYAPWCPACQSIAKPWEELGKWAEQTNYNIAEVDITEGSSIGNQLMATRIPAIYHVKDGVFSKYDGGRGFSAWQEFLLARQSEKLPHFPWYRAPGYPPMLLFGGLMTFAMKVHGLQQYMTNELKIPASLSVGFLLIVPLVLFIVIILGGTYTLHAVFGKPKRPETVGPQRAKPRLTSTCSSSPSPDDREAMMKDVDDELNDTVPDKKED